MKKIILFALALGINIFFAGLVMAAGTYTPMEKIPGTTDDINTFPAYVRAIYKFAIWSVGIAALLMISIGGFFYFAAAGNTSKMETGKKIIADALYGLFAVLLAYVILHTINPNLTTISITSLSN